MREKKIFLLIILAFIFILPSNVFALTDDELQEKKEITLKSVPITDDDSFYQANENLYYELGYQLVNCNETYTTCSVYKGADDENIIATDVTIKYEYDTDVKKVVDDILKDIPEGGKSFYIEDVFAIKWILDSIELDKVNEENEGINPIKYSKEFNSFIGYNNFFFEPRQGDDTMYTHYAEGPTQFKYDGTIYGYGHMATRVDNILYVNDNETDIEGALKTRLSKYFNIDKIVKDDEVTIDDLINDELDGYKGNYDDCLTQKEQVDALYQEYLDLQTEKTTLEHDLEELYQVAEEDRDDDWYAAEQLKRERLDEINNDNLINQKKNQYDQDLVSLINACYILNEYESADEYAESFREIITDPDSLDALWNIKSKVLPNIYVIYFNDNDEYLESGIPVFVAKDSSKVFTGELEVKTRDTKSGVTISNVGTSKKLPFDTLVKVSKLTSGNDYNKVVSALENLINKDNIEMFDLKLFSNALENYITELDDGTFKVKIPLSDKFKEATSMIAYYVDDNNKVHEYPVTFEMIDNVKYAVFTTDHFSVYTLSEKVEEKEPTFKLTYNFNGGSRQGESEYVLESVAVGMDITKANFINNMNVTIPEGKELDAIEINGVRTELDSSYILNKDTTFKYLWKEIIKENDEQVTGDETNSTTDTKNTEEKKNNPQTNDNIMMHIYMFGLSSLGLVVSGLYSKKKKFN